MSPRVTIHKLPSGVPGLDEVLGGGIPEFSFNLIAGGPGSGKTTLGHQIMFANASPERTAIYFNILGEPPLKMLRYQQQYSFFDASKVGSGLASSAEPGPSQGPGQGMDGCIRYVHLGEEAESGGPAKVLERIIEEVEASSPRIVVVDSFRAVIQKALEENEGEFFLQNFMQRLATHLTSCEATTFLIGEYLDEEKTNNSVFTIADGILWLYQALDRNSMVRKLQIMKMRGQGQIPGLHTLRIAGDGVRVFPRLLKPHEPAAQIAVPRGVRLSTGVASLDAMLGGGIPRGYSTLLVGPSGSGKTVLSNQFIIEGVRKGESGVIAVFEKRPNDYLQTAPHGSEFEDMVRGGKLDVLYLRPLDLSIDETLLALRESVLRMSAKRVVIDSLSGLELALAPTFRDEFRESLYRMMGALTVLGVTLMATVEMADSYTDLRFSPQGIAFLTDCIIMQRYFEMDGQLRRALAVVKVRASEHSKDLREYEVDERGLVIGGNALDRYEGVLSGAPRRRDGGKTLP